MKPKTLSLIVTLWTFFFCVMQRQTKAVISFIFQYLRFKSEMSPLGCLHEDVCEEVSVHMLIINQESGRAIKWRAHCHISREIKILTCLRSLCCTLGGGLGCAALNALTCSTTADLQQTHHTYSWQQNLKDRSNFDDDLWFMEWWELFPMVELLMNLYRKCFLSPPPSHPPSLFFLTHTHTHLHWHTGYLINLGMEQWKCFPGKLCK